MVPVLMILNESRFTSLSKIASFTRYASETVAAPKTVKSVLQLIGLYERYFCTNLTIKASLKKTSQKVHVLNNRDSTIFVLATTCLSLIVVKRR